MNKDLLLKKLNDICNNKNISSNHEVLKNYSEDLSFVLKKIPHCIIWPSKAEEVEEILKDAEEVIRRNEKLGGELEKMGRDNSTLKKELASIKTKLEKVLIDG